MNQIPNLISILRTILAIALAIFVLKNPENKSFLMIAFWMTWLIITLDGLDGVVARYLKSESDFGAFFDIACDRITELIYISLFIVLKWIPFWILAVFLVRGILVDGIRGLALKEGKTAFGTKSMMQSSIGVFLTSSRFMRAFYGTVKASAFAFMFLFQANCREFLPAEMILIYLMTFICIIRGMPVLIEGRRFFR